MSEKPNQKQAKEGGSSIDPKKQIGGINDLLFGLNLVDLEQMKEKVEKILLFSPFGLTMDELCSKLYNNYEINAFKKKPFLRHKLGLFLYSIICSENSGISVYIKTTANSTWEKQKPSFSPLSPALIEIFSDRLNNVKLMKNIRIDAEKEVTLTKLLPNAI